MFVYKTEKELQEMTQEQRDAYAVAKREYEAKTSKEQIDSAVSKTKEELQAEIDKMKQANEDLATKLQELAESTKGSSDESINDQVDKFIKENHATIKEAFKNRAGALEIKLPALVTTANGALPTALPANFVAERDGVGNIPLRRANLLDYVRTYNTNQKTLAYVEAEPKEGNFAVVAEGEEKPQLDIKWETRWVQPIKFAGWIKVTEEVIEDIPQLRDLIVNYLSGKHDLFKEGQVFSYINTNSTAYVTGQGLSGATTTPNIMDVVLALQAQIINTPNYLDEPDFMGNVVLMNVIDFYKEYGLAKDDNGRPLYNINVNGTNVFMINGFTFVVSKLVSTGNIYLFDGTKIDVTTYSPYKVEIGWVNDDFIKNLFVILGESRGHILIRNHDKRAFVKGSIATIKSDLEQGAPSV